MDEFKAINAEAKENLTELNRKIAEFDLQYARQLVKNDIGMMQAAKSVLESKKR